MAKGEAGASRRAAMPPFGRHAAGHGGDGTRQRQGGWRWGGGVAPLARECFALRTALLPLGVQGGNY
eukprot:6024983-Prymnesium_polylepis.2